MELNVIKASVKERRISLSDYVPPTAGNVKHDFLQIALDEEWDGLDKRVTFYRKADNVERCGHRHGTNETLDYTFEWDGVSDVEIPWEVIANGGRVGFTVVGSENGIDRLVTEAMDGFSMIHVARGGNDEGVEPSTPTEDVIRRIDSVAADLEQKVASGYFKGAKGDTGATGQPGRDGFSPTATVTKSGKVSTITITDKNGTTTAQVMDGERGERGLQGERGLTGERGLPGERGSDGAPGRDGVDGHSPVITASKDGADTTIYSDGVAIAEIKDGAPGAPGKDGAEYNDTAIRRRLDNLEAAAKCVLYREDTDTTEAYTKDVPAGAMPWASVDNVGGKTVVWNQQLILTGLTSATVNGVTFTVNEDKSVTVNGTASGNAQFFSSSDVDKRMNFVGGHKYAYVCYGTNSGLWFIASTPYGRYTNNNMTLDSWNTAWNGKNNQWGIRVTDGTTVNNVTLRPMIFDLTQMFGAGNEPSTVDEFRAMFPADYYPYNPGELMSAEVVEVESRGKNLVKDVFNGYFGNAGELVANTTHKTPIANLAPGIYTFKTTIADAYITRYMVNGSLFNVSKAADQLTFSVPENCEFMITVRNATTTGIGENVTFQIERGTTATPYSPYGVKGTFDIPQSVRDLCPGYGWSAGSVFNEIDFDAKKYVQRVGKYTFSGSETWATAGDGASYVENANILTGFVFGRNITTSIDCVCDGVPSGALYKVRASDDLMIAVQNNNGNSRFWVSKGLTSAGNVASYMAGKTIYLVLAEPIEVDLSSVLPDDHSIQVEPGGTLTFKNTLGDDYRLPVPNQETFVISTADAI